MEIGVPKEIKSQENLEGCANMLHGDYVFS
jgi:hypothetical protein